MPEALYYNKYSEITLLGAPMVAKKSELTPHDVRHLRRRYKEGLATMSAMAAEFNVSVQAISNIIKGKTWKHVGIAHGEVTLVTKYKSTYIVWHNMIARCTKTDHVSYMAYGGRGIKVCDSWLSSFETFLKDIGERPSLKHSLDRIDADGHYILGNVRWATDKEQGRNKRNTVRIEWPEGSGEIKSAADVAESLGIDYRTFRSQLIQQGKWPNQPPTLTI